MTSAYAALLLVTCYYVISCDGERVNGRKLAAVLDNLADDAMGYTRIQGFLRDVKCTESPLPAELLTDMTQNLESRFSKANEALRKLVAVVEEGYRRNDYTLSPSDIVRCTDASRLKLDKHSKFLQKVDVERACISVASGAAANYTVVLSPEVLNRLKDEFQTGPKWLKLQYIGTTEGITTSYPAVLDKSELENRIRPWYINTAVTPIDVVIALDASNNMNTGSLLQVQKNLANSVISSLHTDSRVGVVSYNGKAAQSPVGDQICVGERLSVATPSVRRMLTNFINEDLHVDFESDYNKGLESVFNMLKHTPSNDNKKVIIFITGTGDHRPKVLSKLDDLISSYSENISIFTLGIGDGVNANLLEAMANRSRPQSLGGYIPVPDTADVRMLLMPMWSMFSNFDDTDLPTLSIPYADFNGLGFISSLCMPLYTNVSGVRELKGVACVDVATTELADEVEFFNHGQLAYSYLVDTNGRTIIHPLLPRAMQEEDGESIHISIFERTPPAVEAYTSLISGLSGNLTGNKANFTVTLGNSSVDGIRIQNVDASFHWMPISGTNLGLCIVLADTDRIVNIANEPDKANNFVYYRLDLVSQFDSSVQLCRYLGKLSLIESSAVKFSYKSFISPGMFEQFADNNRTFDVKRYTLYMNEGGLSVTEFKPDLRKLVSWTSLADNIWRQTSRDDQYIVWRYIGTELGFVRLYPGNIIDRVYDPTVRLWYKRAIAMPHQLHMEPPYVDAFGAGTITTISRALHIYSSNQNSWSIGVAGIDLKMDFVKKIITDEFTDCAVMPNVCFLVERGGFIVYHSEFDYEKKPLETKHLTEEEPEIAFNLQKEGYLTSSACLMVQAKVNIHHWKLDLRGFTISQENAGYDFHEVEGTNLFVGMRQTKLLTSKCSCSSTYKAPLGDTPSCLDMECECPCFVNSPYHYCTNQHNITSSNSAPVCFPWIIKREYANPILDDKELVNRLDECYTYFCSNYTSESQCKGVVEECKWCQHGTPSCMKPEDECKPQENPANGKYRDVILGAAIGAAVVVVLILVITLCVLHRRNMLCAPTKPRIYVTSDDNYALPPDYNAVCSRDSASYSSIRSRNLVDRMRDMEADESVQPPQPTQNIPLQSRPQHLASSSTDSGNSTDTAGRQVRRAHPTPPQALPPELREQALVWGVRHPLGGYVNAQRGVGDDQPDYDRSVAEQSADSNTPDSIYITTTRAV